MQRMNRRVVWCAATLLTLAAVSFLALEYSLVYKPYMLSKHAQAARDSIILEITSERSTRMVEFVRGATSRQMKLDRQAREAFQRTKAARDPAVPASVSSENRTNVTTFK